MEVVVVVQVDWLPVSESRLSVLIVFMPGLIHGTVELFRVYLTVLTGDRWMIVELLLARVIVDLRDSGVH